MRGTWITVMPLLQSIWTVMSLLYFNLSKLLYHSSKLPCSYWHVLLKPIKTIMSFLILSTLLCRPFNPSKLLQLSYHPSVHENCHDPSGISLLQPIKTIMFLLQPIKTIIFLLQPMKTSMSLLQPIKLWCPYFSPSKLSCSYSSPSILSFSYSSPSVLSFSYSSPSILSSPYSSPSKLSHS